MDKEIKQSKSKQNMTILNEITKERNLVSNIIIRDNSNKVIKTKNSESSKIRNKYSNQKSQDTNDKKSDKKCDKSRNDDPHSHNIDSSANFKSKKSSDLNHKNSNYKSIKQSNSFVNVAHEYQHMNNKLTTENDNGSKSNRKLKKLFSNKN